MIISDRVQGVSPSKLPGQGRHAHEPLVPAQVIRKDVQKQKFWPCVPNRHLHCTIRRTMATKTKCRKDWNNKWSWWNWDSSSLLRIRVFLPQGKVHRGVEVPHVKTPDDWIWKCHVGKKKAAHEIHVILLWCATWPCDRGWRRWRSRTREARVQPWRKIKCAPASLSVCVFLLYLL